MIKLDRANRKLSWYFSPIFVLFWFALFYVVVLPIYHSLPDSLSVHRERDHAGEFIGERAAHILFELDMLGPKPLGSSVNGHYTIEILLQEIEKVRRVMRNDTYELVVEQQTVSDSTPEGITYRGVQNVLVKLQSLVVSDENYLLINSHFDTVSASPGAGDAGQMIAVMLELLRVLATSQQVFTHPIVLLFNGAEERQKVGSDGFLHQHPWAKKCQAFINLEALGSGDQETLLYTFGQHEWLSKYYLSSVPRPFGSSLITEMFTLMPVIYNDDSRNFNELQRMPGLDLVVLSGNYHHHTPYDKYFMIPHGALQAIGSNVLALTRELANAKELVPDHSKGAVDNNSPVVYYDFLRLIMLRYSHAIGIVINCCCIVLTLLLLGIGLWRIAAVNYLIIWEVTRAWLLMLILQLIGYALAFALPSVIAVLYDRGSAHSMTLCWYTNNWLAVGLYMCPAIFGLSMPKLVYMRFGRHYKLNESFKTQLMMHAHALILALACLITTTVGYRASYLLMVALFFHIGSTIISMVSTLYRRNNYYWLIVQTACQVLPFLYFSYMTYVCLRIWMPMMGIMGTYRNPDLYVAFICATGAILCFGFIMPMLNAVRYCCETVSALLLGITLLFGLLTLTPIGFPYRETTNVQRINVQHAQRIFYEQDGLVSLNESGFQLNFHDRRGIGVLEQIFPNQHLQSTTGNCTKYMMCNFPSLKSPLQNWLPANESLVMTEKPNLVLMRRTPDNTLSTMRFDFELSNVAPHMYVAAMPFENINITNSTFPIKNRQFVERTLFNGQDKTSLRFFIEVEIPNSDLRGPHLELAIATYYEDKQYKRSELAIDFLNKLPPYIFADEWPSLYEVYVF